MVLKAELGALRKLKIGLSRAQIYSDLNPGFNLGSNVWLNPAGLNPGFFEVNWVRNLGFGLLLFSISSSPAKSDSSFKPNTNGERPR